jgi:hypothetical protein
MKPPQKMWGLLGLQKREYLASNKADLIPLFFNEWFAYCRFSSPRNQKEDGRYRGSSMSPEILEI